MEKTYYKILKKHNSGADYFMDIEFSDAPEGFFLPITIQADSREGLNDRLIDFIGTNSQLIK